jgi:quercetin dioxygenase-like cupin family protein
MSLHSVTRAGTAQVLASGLHTRVERVELAADERLGPHVHAYEQSAYLLAGSATLAVDGLSVELAGAEGGFVPAGAAHGWRAGERGAVWLEASAPPPRAGTPPDTWDAAAAALATGRYRACFRDPGDAPAGLPTAALTVFGGAALRMLVDARLGAALHTLFTVRFAPGATLAAHDHPFEEAYVVLEGRIDAIVEHERITLGPGDALWTGVGCLHAFENPYDAPVRWLETQAPQPPARHGFRFPADWGLRS